MKQVYRMARVENRSDFYGRLYQMEWAFIDKYPWRGGTGPRAQACAAYDDNGLWVCLRAYEKWVRAEYRMRNDPVCCDSCLEFFFAPTPDRGLKYFNFEFNPLGTAYIGFSPTGLRADSAKIADAPDNAYFDIETTLRLGERPDACWQVCFCVPYAFIRRFVPEFSGPGADMQGNFYKCGDKTDSPHWGSWNAIDLPAPDFHTPAFFGILKFR